MGAWGYLVLAGLFEIGFASMLKLTENFTRLWPSVLFSVFAIASFLLLERAAETLPIGTAYAVWTGIGAVGTIIVGIVFYGDPATAWRMFFLSTLVGSIIGLRLTT